MFKIHECHNTKRHVLVEIDVNVLMCMIASFGRVIGYELKEQIKVWGFTEAQAEHAHSFATTYGAEDRRVSLYREVKEGTIEAFKEYVESGEY